MQAYGIYARVVDVSKIEQMSAANQWDFWYKNNKCVNIAQGTFHVVLLLLYTYWGIHHLASLLFQIFQESSNAEICLYTPWNDKENEVPYAYISIKKCLVKIKEGKDMK